MAGEAAWHFDPSPQALTLFRLESPPSIEYIPTLCEEGPVHEMSIVQSLFEIIEEAMLANGLTRVTAVRMRVGEMAAVVPDSLDFCFEVLARGTRVEGAVLEMTVVPLTGKCGPCGREFPVVDYQFACPDCLSTSITLIGGEELCLDELEGE